MTNFPGSQPPAGSDPTRSTATGRGEAGFARLVHLTSVGSTNVALAQAVRDNPGAWPHLSALRADEQTAGRGRAARQWFSPPGASLALSCVIYPPADRASWGWAPLLAGLAGRRAIAALRGEDRYRDLPEVYLKWPNDLVIHCPDAPAVDGWGQLRKVGGVLCEVIDVPEVDNGAGVVVGLGINTRGADALIDIPWAGELACDPDDLTVALGRELAEIFPSPLAGLSGRWVPGHGWQVSASKPRVMPSVAQRREIEEALVTLGQPVRVKLPGGREVSGDARALADGGALVVAGAQGDHLITAGDVHLRANLLA